MNIKTALFLLFSLGLVCIAPEALADTSGEEAKNIILSLMKDVLEVIVWFIGAVLDEIVRAIKAILPDFGFSN